jgi:tetraprenyl-beta-curcumene synthase
MSALDDRKFVARAGLALARSHARYWTSVAPLVRSQLRRWEARAADIPDPLLGGLAREKLRDERFNVEVAAMIATIAPARHRARSVQAIVALQIMYDYLDGLTEQPMAEPIRSGLQCAQAFIDSVAVFEQPAGDYYALYGGEGDRGYLGELVDTVRGGLRELPAIDAIANVIPKTLARCAEAQVRIHAIARAGQEGKEQLARWAIAEADGSDLECREWLFGAMGSVVAAHALIAAAADEQTTRRQASELDSLYLSLCVLTTALDHVVDHERDILEGEQSYLQLYASPQELAGEVATVAARVLEHARTMPDGPHHAMILAGVVAYYTSQPSATSEVARPVTEHIRGELTPLITPTLATMHAWRLAKRLDAPRTQRRILGRPEQARDPIGV